MIAYIIYPFLFLTNPIHLINPGSDKKAPAFARALACFKLPGDPGTSTYY